MPNIQYSNERQDDYTNINTNKIDYETKIFSRENCQWRRTFYNDKKMSPQEHKKFINMHAPKNTVKMHEAKLAELNSQQITKWQARAWVSSLLSLPNTYPNKCSSVLRRGMECVGSSDTLLYCCFNFPEHYWDWGKRKSSSSVLCSISRWLDGLLVMPSTLLIIYLNQPVQLIRHYLQCIDSSSKISAKVNILKFINTFLFFVYFLYGNLHMKLFSTDIVKGAINTL